MEDAKINSNDVVPNGDGIAIFHSFGEGAFFSLAGTRELKAWLDQFLAEKDKEGTVIQLPTEQLMTIDYSSRDLWNRRSNMFLIAYALKGPMSDSP